MKNLLYFIIVILFIVSCDKYDKDAGSEILIGNIEDMIVTNYNTIMKYTQKGDSLNTLDLDLNHDSIKDIRLILGPSPSILCLSSNSGIMGEYITDTAYLNRYTKETHYYKADTIYNVTIEHRSIYGRCRKNQKDSIIGILPKKFKLLPKEDGDFISQHDIFNSDTIDLYIPSTRVKIVEDTIIGYEIVTIHDKNYEATIRETKSNASDYCHSLPIDQICYIGVKLDVLNKEKIGWIKLAVEPRSILLISSAFQN